ncbi:hypothetical protein KL930_000029 [Ogataea haglerorum]|nr:hypothetical protein KL930_000029 [Ogataea haglerorum]
MSEVPAQETVAWACRSSAILGCITEIDVWSRNEANKPSANAEKAIINLLCVTRLAVVRSCQCGQSQAPPPVQQGTYRGRDPKLRAPDCQSRSNHVSEVSPSFPTMASLSRVIS